MDCRGGVVAIGVPLYFGNEANNKYCTARKTFDSELNMYGDKEQFSIRLNEVVKMIDDVK